MTMLEVPAIQITPYKYALLYITHDGADGECTIACRRWTEDGTAIWLMLDNHLFHRARPDELVCVSEVPREGPKPDWLLRAEATDRERMARPTDECSEVY